MRGCLWYAKIESKARRRQIVLMVKAKALWAAAGFLDTLLRCSMGPEVAHGNEAAVQPGVQA
jgi:hypothetical protein